MKKLTKCMLRYINVRDLVTNVMVATILLTVIACGGGKLLPVPGPGSGLIAQLIHIPASGHRIIPRGSHGPVEAALFATVATPSQLAQSFDMICTKVNTIPTTGSLLPIPGTVGNDCDNAVTQPLHPSTDGQGGKATYFDGTLVDLIVTGKTASGATFQCRDITNSLAVLDNSITQPYLDPFAHRVLILNQAPNGTVTTAPFVCNGIGTDGDAVASIEVQFVKQ